MHYTPDTLWMRQVERAADELKRGRAVYLRAQAQPLLVLALEHAPHADSAPHGVQRAAKVVLAAATAAQLGYRIPTDAHSVAFAVSVTDHPDGLALLAPESFSAQSLDAQPASQAEEAARMLVRMSGQAPAALIVPAIKADDTATMLDVSESDILRYRRLKPTLERVTPQPVALPLKARKDTRVLAFRDTLTQATHLLLMLGEPQHAHAPLVRLHSSCLTGDVLGSLRCECGDQLHGALAALAQEEAGVLIYLNQEGRGIGLTNKLRAYGLQDRGLDTVDANIMLGFEPDERDFSLAAQMLRSLSIGTVRLLTNNPAKIEALSAEKIIIKERIPLQIPAGEHNHAYLAAKAQRLRHLL